MTSFAIGSGIMWKSNQREDDFYRLIVKVNWKYPAEKRNNWNVVIHEISFIIGGLDIYHS